MSSSAAAPSTPSPWLFGRAVDLGLGYGLAYLVSVPVLAGLVAAGHLGEGIVWVGGLLALFFSTPHYGATLLRVYDRRGDRQRYVVFTVWITAALVALLGVALWNVWIASLLVTVYVTWSPWHFSGQNYGLSVMYLRRRGVTLPPATKRDLYVSFVLSAVLAILAVHLAGSQSVFALGTADPSGTVGVLSLGIPLEIIQPLAAAVALAYVVFLGRVVWGLLRQAPAAALLPVGLLICTQALWFSLPGLASAMASTTLPPELALPLSVVWVSSAHAIQYLWVTSYYARQTDETPSAPFLLRSLLAGACLSVPVFLLFPNALGGYFPNAAAASVIVFSVVNLHHFILDGAIWKLRDGKVASALLRDAPPAPVGPSASGRSWLRGTILTLGAASVVFQLYAFRLSQLASSPDTPYEVLLPTAKRLESIGKAPPELWARVGQLAEDEHPGVAIASYQRAVKADRQPPLWLADRLAWTLLEHRADKPARIEQARKLAVYMTRKRPDRPEGFRTLSAVQAALGEWEAAAGTAEAGLALAREQGDPRLTRDLEERAARYRRRAAGGESAPSAMR